jgi:hypothetical protein
MAHKTTAEKQAHVHAAREFLEDVRVLRIGRASAVATAIENHGWHGPLISGVEQDHWPADVKDALRRNARAISRAMDNANNEWRKAGKRQHTFNRLLADYRVEGSRY